MDTDAKATIRATDKYMLHPNLRRSVVVRHRVSIRKTLQLSGTAPNVPVSIFRRLTRHDTPKNWETQPFLPSPNLSCRSLRATISIRHLAHADQLPSGRPGRSCRSVPH